VIHGFRHCLVWVACVLIFATVILVSGQTTQTGFKSKEGGAGDSIRDAHFLEALPDTVVDAHSHAK
jgi:hypothetical protein